MELRRLNWPCSLTAITEQHSVALGPDLLIAQAGVTAVSAPARAQNQLPEADTTTPAHFYTRPMLLTSAQALYLLRKHDVP
jgi:hypothetical protein